MQTGTKSLPLCACGRPADKVPSKQRLYRRAIYKAQGRRPSSTFVVDEPVCNRCLALDGEGSSRYDIIAALRDFGLMVPAELALVAGLSEQNVSHILRRLMNAGRVERVLDPSIEGYSDNIGGFAYRLTRD